MLTAVVLAVLTLTPSATAVCVTGFSYAWFEPQTGLIFQGTVAAVPDEIVLETVPVGSTTVEVTGLRVRLTVDRVWKGDPGTDVEIVYTHHAGQLSGRFTKGDRFIVWADMRDGLWRTSDCAPTIERDLASAEMLTFLEQLKNR